MTPTQTKTDQYLRNFAHSMNTQLSLRNGVCAIYDHLSQQNAVVEVPDFSDNIIFHCVIMTLPSDLSAEVMRKILLLNFEISAMQGCWLAIDEQQQLCLCHLLPIDKTDQQLFNDSLIGFIEQVKQVRPFVTPWFSAPVTH
ncbi:type III secretion system chaperone [Vibrio tritonius]|uniref:Type III secretion system chaperone n=1 Tax=Vibrio tritonius TaxID=1435069 RepID=A0ABS7YT35_9VIBR|nr:type III secretion system chaperone [Vibrio tritonius]MCA2018848.1 type III secretion system chaperone [Vibrio tritonius]